MEKWTTTSSKTLVDDKWLKLRVDSCITPAGGIVDTYYVMEFGDWANCVVFDSESNLIMIRQYRHGIHNFVSEFVSGGLEPDDPSPEVGIRRELEEEIGYVGGQIYQTGISYANPGAQNNKIYSFLAIGGDCIKPPQHEVGETITIEKTTIEELLENLENPDSKIIYQSMHIAALFFALSFIKRSSLASLQDIKKRINTAT